MTIASIKHKGLKLLYEKNDSSKLPSCDVKRIKMRLTLLDVAMFAEDMNRPGWNFHKLLGSRKGYFSVSVRANWKIVFRFDGKHQHAYDVDFIDYHGRNK